MHQLEGGTSALAGIIPCCPPEPEFGPAASCTCCRLLVRVHVCVIVPGNVRCRSGTELTDSAAHQMGVVDLDDEDYMPRGAPTMFGPLEVGHNLTRIEDVRLFSYRGELHVLFEGMQWAVRPNGRVRWRLFYWLASGTAPHLDCAQSRLALVRKPEILMRVPI
jgi:hypothetical protein